VGPFPIAVFGFKFIEFGDVKEATASFVKFGEAATTGAAILGAESVSYVSSAGGVDVVGVRAPPRAGAESVEIGSRKSFYRGEALDGDGLTASEEGAHALFEDAEPPTVGYHAGASTRLNHERPL
jgi:hypothetical protein